MRQRRIKISPADNEAAYHCISRTVNGEWLFDDAAKEILRRQLWQVADYCGIHIVTYTILSNHFHVLVDVPPWQPLPDAELLRRYHVLYPIPTKHQAARLEVIVAELSLNGPQAMLWRQRQLALMGDVSQFMKLVKQRFSIWFNKSHQRFGTLWAERFKSVLVEVKDHALQTMAAYIDLNSVRAGIVRDPKEYRFCGYAEAVAGSASARAGIQRVVGGCNWSDAQAHYRELLFGTGAGIAEAAASIPLAEFQRVVAAGGRLPLAAVLRCRLRYFTDGAVLGSKAFVQTQLATYRPTTGCRKQPSPLPLPAWTDWGDLAIMRGLREHAFG
ncbi:MAG: transposase [Opitutaceae bacterium]|nr:transposase [Opitutaceae bacterium]